MEGFDLPICPECKNKENRLEANFCSECGAPLQNKCTDNCGDNPFTDGERLLGSNEKHCYHCGAESLFKQKGLLG